MLLLCNAKVFFTHVQLFPLHGHALTRVSLSPSFLPALQNITSGDMFWKFPFEVFLKQLCLFLCPLKIPCTQEKRGKRGEPQHTYPETLGQETAGCHPVERTRGTKELQFKAVWISVSQPVCCDPIGVRYPAYQIFAL